MKNAFILSSKQEYWPKGVNTDHLLSKNFLKITKLYTLELHFLKIMVPWLESTSSPIHKLQLELFTKQI